MRCEVILPRNEYNFYQALPIHKFTYYTNFNKFLNNKSNVCARKTKKPEGILIFLFSKPQVNYATALDVFIILCFAIVFAALVEFAMLNFLDTLVRKLKRKESHQQSIKVVSF